MRVYSHLRFAFCSRSSVRVSGGSAAAVIIAKMANFTALTWPGNERLVENAMGVANPSASSMATDADCTNHDMPANPTKYLYEGE